MLLVEVKQLELSIGPRQIVDVDQLKIYKRDRIGIVGANGAGKSTLIKLLAGVLQPDAGLVQTYARTAYIPQDDESTIEDERSSAWYKDFGVPEEEAMGWSGGERVRWKIAHALSEQAELLLADEPTANLDLEGIRLLEEALLHYDGAIVLISHDRILLDRLCTKIWEVEDAHVQEFTGNYSEYVQLKQLQLKHAEEAYEAYTKEKKRLVEAIQGQKTKAETMRKTPKRMGNSEARLHKRKVNEKKQKLEGKSKTIESRLNQLEVQHKPRKRDTARMDAEADPLYSKIVVSCEHVELRAGDKLLLADATFQIHRGDKVALIGPNGSGKTTLLNAMLNKHPAFTWSKAARIGVFTQDRQDLKPHLSVLDNVLPHGGTQDEVRRARHTLARLLFDEEAQRKPVHVLSGGEQVKVSMAKLLLSQANVLILDEPTNFLDLPALEALQAMLVEYEGTLLFVSHDRAFTDELATKVLWIEAMQLREYTGNASEASQRLEQVEEPEEREATEALMLLELKVSELLARLSTAAQQGSADLEALEAEYVAACRELREMKRR